MRNSKISLDKRKQLEKKLNCRNSNFNDTKVQGALIFPNPKESNRYRSREE